MEKRVRASVVCVQNNHLLAVELQDPVTKKRFWSLPGGAIEENETAAQAAAREAFEETGYRMLVDEQSCLTNQYLFRWNGQVYDCETWWFRGTLEDASPATVSDADYLLHSKWVPLNRLDELFSYHPIIMDTLRRFIASP